MKNIPAFLNLSTLSGLFCLPLLFGIVTIKLIPQVTMLVLLLSLVGLVIYPMAQWREKKSWKSVLGGVGIAFIVGITAFVALRLVVFEPRYIVGTAMTPTLEEGARLVGDKTSYWFKSPQRGDVILFQPLPGDIVTTDQVSRVIGLPGETIELKNGSVWINHKVLDEPYVKAIESIDLAFEPFKVKKQHYFVLSDNRDEVWQASNESLPLSQQVPRKALIAFMKARMFSWRSLDS